jgi:acyl-coenzyme A thioesterase PaaI-like protein
VKTPLEVVDEARRTGDYTVLTRAVPYARFLGFTLDASSGELLGKLSFSDMLIGNPTLPALHGGTIAALLESTAIFTLLLDSESGVLPKIINITIAYLRSGRPVDTFARCVISKHGRRVAAVHVEAWQDAPSQPIATALAHFLIEPAEP